MEIGILRQRNPNYQAGYLKRYEALYHGKDRWTALTKYWIPRHPDETQQVYDTRLTRALYVNHAGPILDFIVGSLFTQPPSVEGFSGDWYVKFLGNVDRQGTVATSWFSQYVRDCLIYQRAFAWVNLPSRDGLVPASRADEERLGLLDAYLTSLTGKDVIDWGYTEDNRLEWIVTEECRHDRPNVNSKRRKYWRWTSIDAAEIRRWEWYPPEEDPDAEPKDEERARQLEPVAHGIAELPIVELTVPDGLHAMGKMHDPAIAHIRSRNDLSWALHRGAHPMLYIKQRQEPDQPVLGPGRYLHVPIDGEIGFVEPAGTSFQLLADDTVQLREELYRVVHQMAVGADSNSSRSRASGAAKSMDWNALAVVLAALAEIVRPRIARTLRLVAKARGEDLSPTVSGLENWEDADIQNWLANAALAVDASNLSPTFKREMAKREARALLVGAAGETLTKIEGEIDSSTPDMTPFLPPGAMPMPTVDPAANKPKQTKEGAANRATGRDGT